MRENHQGESESGEMEYDQRASCGFIIRLVFNKWRHITMMMSS